MQQRSSTARRLFFSFGGLVALFVAAAFFAMAGLTEIHDGLHELGDHAKGARTALQLASAVQAQYARQMGALAAGQVGPFEVHESARLLVASRLDALARFADDETERGWLAEIGSAVGELDRRFREDVVPALQAQRLDEARRHQARLAELAELAHERAELFAARVDAPVETFEQHAAVVEHGAVRWTLVLLVAAVASAIGVGLYIVRWLARPVAELEAAAARLGAGDLDVRLEVEGPDELVRLAEQFNRMAAALKEHQERLLQTEKLAAVGQLASGVAHEINNPLGVILGYVRLLRRGADDKLAADLAILEEEAVRCQEIVEGLLDLSRPMSVGDEHVDLRLVCDEVVDRLRESGALDGVAVATFGQGAVEGSRARLRQVVHNLVKNAVEASGPGGSVRVDLAGSTDGIVTLAVRDSGGGIPSQGRNHLFEPFYTTKPSGTGLGLAVSQAIARAHGGTLEADDAPDGGAVFTLRLPALRATVEAA